VAGVLWRTCAVVLYGRRRTSQVGVVGIYCRRNDFSSELLVRICTRAVLKGKAITRFVPLRKPPLSVRKCGFPRLIIVSGGGEILLVNTLLAVPPPLGSRLCRDCRPRFITRITCIDCLKGIVKTMPGDVSFVLRA
jgi:hypothetical protein